MRYKTCGSIEGKRYKAPWRQWVSTTEAIAKIVVDWRDADLVEQAWRQLLGKYRLILRYTYMHNFPPWVVAKKCGIKRWYIDQELGRAKRALAAALLTTENR